MNTPNPQPSEHHYFDQIKIVMVQTTLAANIGAAARAMKTMGIGQLTLVSPKYFPHADATALAAGAQDILEQATVVATLEEALADCHIVFATSSRTRSIPWPLLDARASAEQAIAQIQQAHPQPCRIALVFGREDRGLTNDELSLANTHLTIPVNLSYGVLNVAAAIQVVCYEFRIAILAAIEKTTPELPTSEQTTLKQFGSEVTIAEVGSINHGAMSQLYHQIEQGLTTLELLDPDKPKYMPLRIKRLFGRMQLDQVEYDMLRSIFGKINRLKASSDKRADSRTEPNTLQTQGSNRTTDTNTNSSK